MCACFAPVTSAAPMRRPQCPIWVSWFTAAATGGRPATSRMTRTRTWTTRPPNRPTVASFAREDLGLLHFLRARRRQAVDEEHPTWRLEVRELAETPFHEAFCERAAGGRARHRHDTRHDLFFADLVEHREHRH